MRVEQLHDITEEQAIAEGFKSYREGNYCELAKLSFAATWNNTIKPKDRERYSWDANPLVWVIEFEKISKEEATEGEVT